TDQLLARCGELRREGPGGVLVKLAKPGQERRADLPTIGPETVRQAIRAGLRGIAVHVGQSLVLEKESLVRSADEHGLFVLGVEPDSFTGGGGTVSAGC
ncbi:MAG: UDP-2,3-diacylglucosamine diphosphatase LpxI domain-containing protein, partial [Alphaproteobacteria bacterium]